jgi:hypothetical protein
MKFPSWLRSPQQTADRFEDHSILGIRRARSIELQASGRESRLSSGAARPRDIRPQAAKFALAGLRLRNFLPE